VVRDKSVITLLSNEAKAYTLRATAAGLLHHFQSILDNPAFDIFYHAPVLIVISTTTETPCAIEDCSLAAANLMLAARAAGLGTCWIGFAQNWLATPKGKAALELPASYRPVAPIILGHPKSTPAPVARREPEIRWIGS
jgi:nitroreductase